MKAICNGFYVAGWALIFAVSIPLLPIIAIVWSVGKLAGYLGVDCDKHRIGWEVEK